MAGDLSEILARVDELKAQIDALRPINPEQEARLMQKLRLEWNYHSNALEGNKLTLGETRAFLLQGLTAHGKPFRDYLDIKGYNEAILLLEDFVHQERPLTEADIRELHKIILVELYHVNAVTFDGTPTRRLIEPGKYKTTPNHVLTSTGEVHYYASPEETPARMGELVAWYRRELEKGELHPLLLAATFHYEFAAIHPFDDGNGRMARLLMNLILMQTGFVPVVVQVDTKEEYLLALEKADAGELEEFITLIGRGLLRSMELYLRAARGERIAEMGDLDKRIRLLQRRLELEKVVIEKSVATQLRVFEDFIKPLFQGLIAVFEQYEQFFNRSLYLLRYEQETRQDTFTLKNSTVIGQLEKTLNTEQLVDRLIPTFKLLQFIRNNASDITLIMWFSFGRYEFSGYYTLMNRDFNFEALEFRLRKNSHSISPKKLLENRYDHLYTEEEIDLLIDLISDDLYQLVEQFIDSSSHPQDPTAP